VSSHTASPLRPPRPWTIVAATFVTLVLTYGVWYSYAVFLVALLREFGWSRSVTAGAFSVFMLAHGLLGPSTGGLIRRIGVRRVLRLGGWLFFTGLVLASATTRWWHLYLAFGGVTAAGMSFVGWVPAVVLIRGWFPARFGTAMGIASAGIGVGITAMVPLAQLLIDLVGWRWTFRVFGFAVIAWLLPATAWLIHDAPPTKAERGDAVAASWQLVTALRDRGFWALAAAFFTGTLVHQLLLVHQVAYLVDHGVSAMMAATVGGIVGFVSIAGKIGWGAVSDRIGRETSYALAFACTAVALGGIAMVARYPVAPLLYGYALAAGVGYGVLSPVQPAAASDLFAGPGFSTIYGALYVAVSAGGAFGAWVAGATHDALGSYSVALWIALLNTIASPLLLWVAAPRRPHPPPRDAAARLRAVSRGRR
jgi:MFS family permease